LTLNFEKVLLSWSGGKDSAFSLLSLQESKIKIAGLVTTLTEEYDRISMHGVSSDLLKLQSASLAIPLVEVWIPRNATNEIYELRMKQVLVKLKEDHGISKIAFGDLFLQDIREYREKLLQNIGFNCLFPIWGMDTRILANNFINSGFRAIVCTLDPKLLSPRFCGREYDRSFLTEIPESVDPCGENGEFHTFVYDGPIFKDTIRVDVGETVQRDGFCFADIIAL
jgi:uncharacterized protein (TIGR00290 family)